MPMGHDGEDFIVLSQGQCLTCGATLNAVGLSEEGPVPMPEPGDLTLCGYCFAPMLFTETLRMRLLTREERLAHVADIAEMEQQLRRMHAQMEAQGWRNPYGRR
jgi:hypothetical protein